MPNGAIETTAFSYHFDNYDFDWIERPSEPIQPRGALRDASLSAIAQSHVIDELNRILANNAFSRSKRLQRFLRYVVMETLANREGRLKEYTIALDVFERDESFDPQTSSIVRTEANRLRGKLNLYNATDGFEDPISIVLPTGSYVPVFRDNKNFAGVRTR